MDKKKTFKEVLSWANTSNKNKQEAINLACYVIAALNNMPSDKRLSQSELENLSGGIDNFLKRDPGGRLR